MAYQSLTHGLGLSDNPIDILDRAQLKKNKRRILIVLLTILGIVVFLYLTVPFAVTDISTDAITTGIRFTAKSSKSTKTDTKSIVQSSVQKSSPSLLDKIGMVFFSIFSPSAQHSVKVGIPIAGSIPPASASPEKLSHKTEEEKQALFEQFKSTHTKKYSNNKEELQRYEIFKENLERIDDLNAKQPRANFHISKFSDLTDEEFQTHTGLRADYAPRIKSILELSPEKQSKFGFSSFESTPISGRMKQTSKDLPSSFDWRTYGAVTPVKDQLQCGACWAFAATGDMEGTWKLKSGSLVSLSEQELISCTTQADGCSGGLMNEAYQFVINNGGIGTESQYPYTSGTTLTTGQCQLSESSPVTIEGWTLIKANTVADLQAALKSEGPIAVAINANQMQFYSSGIDVCLSPGPVNHGVLLVGYGTQDGETFWIIKNSWGISWGQQGYYYISTAKGACGVQTLPMKSL